MGLLKVARISTCFLCVFLSNLCFAKDFSTLKLVNILYRHGDRGPVIIYPKDPNQVSSWPQGFGFLTTKGIDQHYDLGKYYRQRYDGYLNDTYIYSEINVNSSNVNRCLMSAYSNLAGLYPPKGYQLWNDKIPWQPIPVHTLPEHMDNMLAIQAPCPKYAQLFKKSLKSPEVVREEKENKNFYDFVSKKSGVSKESIDNIWQVADALFCEKNHNKTWAKWVNETIYNKLRDLENWSFDLLYKGPIESRLKGGPVLKQFIDNMQAKIADKITQKIMFYSGHDTTIAALLNALHVFNLISPPYTATVIMELHEENKEYYVYTYYKNNTYPNPTTIYNITLPGCDTRCKLDDFVRLTKDRVPVDWQKECEVSDPSKSTISPNNASNVPMIVMGILAGMLLIMTLVIITFSLLHKKRNRFPYSLLEKGSQES